jgi:hypothetical protein
LNFDTLLKYLLGINHGQTDVIIEELEYWGIQPVYAELLSIFWTKPEVPHVLHVWKQLGPFSMLDVSVNEYLIVSQIDNYDGYGTYFG